MAMMQSNRPIPTNWATAAAAISSCSLPVSNVYFRGERTRNTLACGAVMAEIAFCKAARPHFSQVPCRFNCAPFEYILLNVQCNFITYSDGRTHSAILRPLGHTCMSRLSLSVCHYFTIFSLTWPASWLAWLAPWLLGHPRPIGQSAAHLDRQGATSINGRPKWARFPLD